MTIFQTARNGSLEDEIPGQTAECSLSISWSPNILAYEMILDVIILPWHCGTEWLRFVPYGGLLGGDPIEECPSIQLFFASVKNCSCSRLPTHLLVLGIPFKAAVHREA